MISEVDKARTSGPAAIATVATVLQLLQSATSVPGCPPSIAPVCSIALQLIQKTQETQQNQQACKELADKISQIMIAVLKSYSKKESISLPIDVPENIERLHRDLVDISSGLHNILGKNGFKRWVLSSHYQLDISGYSTKLDWAVNFFKLETLLRIENKIDSMTLQRSSSTAPPFTGISNQLLGLPPKPEIFYGREDVVEGIVRRLVSTSNGRFSIGGPGGLGKTSVALTAVHDPRVIAKFEDRRYWVACDRATSASSLIQLVAESLEISTSSNNLLKLVIAQLSRDGAPKLVLLDNFEASWDVEAQRLDVENVLKHLVSVSSVTLLLTVRSESPPCKGLKWTQPVLDPLDTLTPDAARQLYTEYDPDAADDPSLGTLLHALSYMPLAVTLMATRGASGEPPKELLSKWQSLGTATLSRSGTRLESVQISIRLSTESRTMSNNPHALRLLSLLTLLPAGAPKDLLDDIAPDIDADEAFLVLQKVSLAYLDRKSKFMSTLSPIRQFVAEFHPPTEAQLDTVFQVFRGLLLAAHEKADSENSWLPVGQAVIDYFPNVETISLKRLEISNPGDAIDLVIRMCEWNDSPMNLHLVQAASNAARRVANPLLNARCNFALARTTDWTDRPKAISIRKDALVAFRELQDQHYILWCLLSIAQGLHLERMYEEATFYAQQAMDLARSLGEDAQYAESLEVLARIDTDEGKIDDALVKMEEVLQIQRWAIHTKGVPRVIGSFLIYAGLLRQCKRFEEAHEKLEEASVMIQELPDRTYEESWRHQELGNLYRDQDRIDDALIAYTASAAENRKGGYFDNALWQQTDVGDMLARQRRYEDANAEFQRCLEEAQENRFQDIVDYCREQLEHIKKLHGRTTSGESLKLKARNGD